MPIDLSSLAAPAHTAVLTMEMQRGVMGDLSKLDDLTREVAALDITSHTARLLTGARAAGVHVVHCIVEFHADRSEPPDNAPLLVLAAKSPDHLLAGSASAEIVPQLGPESSDVIASRGRGLSPFGGTSLDSTLRELGASTVIATGVSVNLGVLGLAIEAVNLGYRVVVATDAVCGFPRDYAEAVMRNSIGMVAWRATVDELLSVWGQAARAGA